MEVLPMTVRVPFRLPNVFAPDDDRTLLARFTEAQDEAAFAAVVARHARMVYGVCRRAVRDDHRAEDAFQAVFLVLAQYPRKAVAAASVGGWLFGIARRVGAAARRHEERRTRLAITPEPHAASNPDFDDLLRVLDEELAQLPETYRAPLVACFLEERTQDEAAKQLGWSLSTLRRRLERGKELLRARLTRRGATLAGTLFAGVLAPSAFAGVPPRLLEAPAMSSLSRALASQVVGSTLLVKLGFAGVTLVVFAGAALGLVEKWETPALASPVALARHMEFIAAPAPKPAWVYVTGQVVFPDKREIPTPKKVKFGVKDADFFGEPDVGDVLIDAKTRGLANAVVWLRPDSDDKTATFPVEKIYPTLKATPVDHTVTCGRDGFTPRVLAARAGDCVEFVNPTPIGFNVRYQTDLAHGFNILLPADQLYKSKPLGAGRFCDLVMDGIHPWIRGYVWVFDHPYFAVTDAQGNFEINLAPPGNWRLVVWHEKVGYRNGEKGRLGETITLERRDKVELPPFEHLSDAWDEK